MLYLKIVEDFTSIFTARSNTQEDVENKTSEKKTEGKGIEEKKNESVEGIDSPKKATDEKAKSSNKTSKPDAPTTKFPGRKPRRRSDGNLKSSSSSAADRSMYDTDVPSITENIYRYRLKEIKGKQSATGKTGKINNIDDDENAVEMSEMPSKSSNHRKPHRDSDEEDIVV